MTKQTAPSPSLSSFLAIKYWPTWFGLGLLWLVAFMPFSWRMVIGRGLGLLTYHCARDRRYITEINITHCFPELSPLQQAKLVRSSFVENGIGLIESVSSWARNPEYFRPKVRFIGIEKAEAALAQGRGLLILGAHFSTLDLGGALLSLRLPFAATYRPHNNPLFDRFIYRGRLRTCTPLDRNDIRGAFKHLKQGKVLWYAPDQDYHRNEHCVFAPFFGQQASTITTPSRFAKINPSPTFIIRHHRIDKTKSYEVELIPVPDIFPTGDDYRDAILVNSQLEKVIRQFPAQYLWMHKRFKSQPGGKPESPYINIKTSSKKLSSQQFAQLTKDANACGNNNTDPNDALLTLTNGLLLKQFKGIPGRLFASTHAARVFDRNAKLLRSENFGSLTIDNLFMVKSQNITAATYFPLEGEPLSSYTHLPDTVFPAKLLATFFAQLHRNGFLLKHPSLTKIIKSDDSFSILNPEDVIIMPSSIAYIDRFDNLLNLMHLCQRSPAGAKLFCQYYKDASGLTEQRNFMQMLSRLPNLCFEKENMVDMQT